jgi:hypothetical protein
MVTNFIPTSSDLSAEFRGQVLTGCRSVARSNLPFLLVPCFLPAVPPNPVSSVNVPHAGMAAFLYVVYRDEAKTLADVGMWNTDTVTRTGVGEPEGLRVLRMTDGILPARFRSLDQSPALYLPARLTARTRVSGHSTSRASVTLGQSTADLSRLLPVALNCFPPFAGYVNAIRRVRVCAGPKEWGRLQRAGAHHPRGRRPVAGVVTCGNGVRVHLAA